MPLNYQGFELNVQGDPPPTGPREQAVFTGLIDRILSIESDVAAISPVLVTSSIPDFAVWAAAITDNVSLIVDVNTSIGSTVVLPNNVDIIGFYNGARFTGSGSLKINRMSCNPKHQIFDDTLPVDLSALAEGWPEWFGCTYDGTTVDTVAIQKCMSSGVGKTVFGNGTCRTNASIEPPSNHTICGSGKTIIKSVDSQNFVSKGLIHLNNKSFVTIRDIELDGNNINNTVGRSLGIAVVYGSHDVLIDNVYSHNHPASTLTGENGGDGVYIGSYEGGESSNYLQPYNITIRNCNLSANVRQGISIVGGKSIKILYNIITDQTGTDPGAGIDIEPDSYGGAAGDCEDIEIAHNSITGNQHGILLFNGAQKNFPGIRIIGNEINNNTVYGVDILNVVEGATVQGNDVLYNSIGIQIDAGSYSQIVNNRIHHNSQHGINSKPGSRYHIIANNHVFLNGYHGLQTDYVYGGLCDFQIRGNLFANNGTAALNTYDGINVLGNASHPNARHFITDNVIGNFANISATATQRTGIAIAANADGCIVERNNFYLNTNADVLSTGIIAVSNIGAQGNVRTAIISNNSEKISVLPDGKVGVNITTPTSLLHIDDTMANTPNFKASSSDAPTASGQYGGGFYTALQTRKAGMFAVCETDFGGGETWNIDPRVGISFVTLQPGGEHRDCGVTNLGVGYFNDVKINNGGYVYLYGSLNVDGSVRMGYSSGNRITQKRVSGSWVTFETLEM
jgi:hypothetical protein